MSFNFMAAVTICSDFGAQENKVYHCFHCFPIYLPWSDGTRCHDISFLNGEFSANIFTLLFDFHQDKVMQLQIPRIRTCYVQVAITQFNIMGFQISQALPTKCPLLMFTELSSASSPLSPNFLMTNLLRLCSVSCVALQLVPLKLGLVFITTCLKAARDTL